MARALRHEDPRCGREHFDARAGVERDRGPDPSEIVGSTPDVPWNRYKPDSRLLFEQGQWVVTDFGLELLSSVQKDHERYKIPGYELLDMHDLGRVYRWPVQVANEDWIDFDAFEGMFRKALEVHWRSAPQPPYRGYTFYYRCWTGDKRARQQSDFDLRSKRVDADVLEKTFRRARAIARRRAKPRSNF